MANQARARLESALRARRLDRTLTTARPPAPPGAGAVSVAASGVTALDAVLGGGLPRGQLSSMAGPCSSGRTTLLLQALGAATRRGEWVALVDAFDRADPGSMTRAGLVHERVLWVRGQSRTAAPAVAGRGADQGVVRALRAWHLVVQAGGFGVVALDLADASPAVLGRVPFTTWLRAQRALVGTDTAGLVLAPRPVAPSAAGWALVVEGRPRWAGRGAGRYLVGLDIHARVRSPRVPVGAGVTVVATADGRCAT
jgi:hypothetical protein